MAHFAELDSNNIVLRVIVVNNNELIDADGNEVEQKGIEFCQSLLGGTWVQTSYNRNFRKNFAGKGYTYDESRDVFISPQPFPSWTLNEDTCIWESPVPYPDDNEHYQWDEETTSWVEITDA